MPRILIAEDEHRIAAFLERGLRAAGYATTVVTDGRAVATWARDTVFDLLLLDLGLPGMDGLEVLVELRRGGQRLPVIVLTARDAVPDRVAGLEGGADDYVTSRSRSTSCSPASGRACVTTVARRPCSCALAMSLSIYALAARWSVTA